MPDPTDQPTPATPDELAALYLRARDVPCPGCGYNRRDGNTAACPECGHCFHLSQPSPLESPSSRRALRRTSMVILLTQSLAVAATIYTGVVILRIIVENGILPRSYALTLTRTTGHFMLYTAAAYFAFRSLRLTRANANANAKAFRSIMLAALTLAVTPLLSPATLFIFTVIL